MAVDVVSFGCRLNAYEAQVIRRAADGAGLKDTVVVNTCAVTSEAVRQARQTIRRLRREQPAARIVVTGCAAQTEPLAFARMAEVDLVLGNDQKLQELAWQDTRLALDRAAVSPLRDKEKIHVDDIMTVETAALHPAESLHGRARAFIQVQNGCDHRCTFCVIPYGRGNSRSVSMAEVVTQVRQLVERGCREIVLTGVDITSYGTGLPGSPRLGALVKQILKQVPDLARLRISSIDSVEVDHDLLDALASDARFMPHLHLSLQSGDDLLLKRMKRRHQRAQAVAFCERARGLRPDVVLGADLIAGFPTESEAMFSRSLDLVDDCGLVQLHVFPFSLRPGTPAARMPQVPHDVIKERARVLRHKGEAQLRAHLERLVGTTQRLLSEGRDRGRTEHYIAVKLDRAVGPGLIFDVAVTGHDGAQLLTA